MNFFSQLTLLMPQGSIALQERDVIVVATWLMLIIVVPVFMLTAGIAWRYRSTNTRAVYLPNWEHSKIEEFIWWLVPCVIIAIIANMTWKTTHSLDPYRPIPSDISPLEVQVIALRWNWLFIYPQHSIATLNFLELPVNTPVHFTITADAPMNSLWIPSLGGQIYAMPGMQTQLHLFAHSIGTYRGSSANFSGDGFSAMTFFTRVVSRDDFAEWTRSVQGTRAALSHAEYAMLAEPPRHEMPAPFRLETPTLFDDIIMKYMHPAQHMEHK